MVLAENASKIASREKDAPTSIMALDTRLFSKMGPNDIYLDDFGADEAVSCLLVTIDPAETWAEVALSEVAIC